MTDFSFVLNKLFNKEDLTQEEASFVLQEIMQSKVTPTQTAAFLTALKLKGESVSEIAAFAKTMKSKALTFSPKLEHLVDTAGTGGDSSNTFNISTCSAFVAAGAGANVAKHGNKAISSKSGSSDVLGKLGADILKNPQSVEKQLNEIGITFLFAPYFHPAMKSVASVRKELGFKTVFNILGPLLNPANAKRQLVGVYDSSLLEKMAESLKLLGAEKALVVNSDLDEISISSETQVYEVHNGEIKSFTLTPEEFGFKRTDLKEIQVQDISESAETILSVLKGNTGPARDIVVLNAAATLYVSGISDTIAKAISLAENSIDSGKAFEKLELMRGF